MTETHHTPAGVPFVRTDPQAFEHLADFPWPASHITFEGLRLSYVDVGPRTAPVALLMHGMPTWSYLYRNMIPGLVAAGYRCIAADHIGFGRSDKVVDDGWYSIAKHIKAHEDLISQLDLRDVTLFCQDWGGPIGLAQAIDSPSRFRRLVIMNTWMHHPGYAYTPAIVQWNAQWKADGLFGLNVPEPLSLGWLMAMATGRIARTDLFGILQGTALPQLNAADAAVRQAYDAPFHDLGKPGHAGARRSPTAHREAETAKAHRG